MRILPILALATVSGALAQPAVDALELIRRTAAPEKDNSGKASQYAYREYWVTREMDKNGKETSRKTETWDVIGLEGSTYRKLILRNDQPLAPKEQKREDNRLAKEAALRRKESPEQRRNRLFSFSYSVRFRYDRMTDLYDLRYAGEELVDGRPAYVIEGLPKPGLRPRDAEDKETLNYGVKAWIDQQDLVHSRLQLTVITDDSRMRKGTMIDTISSRNEAGVWLAKELRFPYNLKFLKMIDARGELSATYSDYRKFQVDSRIVDGPIP